VRFTRDEWITRLCGDHRDAEPAQSRTCGLVALPASWGSMSCSTSGFGRVRKLPAKIAALAALARLYRVTCSDSVASQPIEKRNTKLSGDFLIVPLSNPRKAPMIASKTTFIRPMSDKERVQRKAVANVGISVIGAKPRESK
jgi:hypothetical protein